MKLTILRNLGSDQLKTLPMTEADSAKVPVTPEDWAAPNMLREGCECEVSDPLGKELIKQGLAEPPAMRGVAGEPAIKAVKTQIAAEEAAKKAKKADEEAKAAQKEADAAAKEAEKAAKAGADKAKAAAEEAKEKQPTAMPAGYGKK